jgi:hypothetical protein
MVDFEIRSGHSSLENGRFVNLEEDISRKGAFNMLQMSVCTVDFRKTGVEGLVGYEFDGWEELVIRMFYKVVLGHGDLWSVVNLLGVFAQVYFFPLGLAFHVVCCPS